MFNVFAPFLGTVAGTSQPPAIDLSSVSASAGTAATFWDEYGPTVMGYAVKVAGVIILLIIASIIAGAVSSIVYRGLSRAKVDMTLAKFAGKTSRWVIMLLSLIACLGVFGVETTSFAAVIGGASLAIGLAFQGSLSNLAAGVMLLLFRPFSVGQAVTVAGQTGIIDEIALFTTEMDTFDNRRIIIPNGAIFGAVIENISHHTVRRADVEVGTDYDADLDNVRGVLELAISKVTEQVDGRESAVVLTGLGASSIDWSVRIWIDAADFWPKKQELMRSIKNELDAAGIGIPYPQRVVTVLKGDEA